MLTSKKLREQAKEVLERATKMESYTDEQLKEKTKEFKEMIVNATNIEKTLNQILPDAFAVACVAAKRVLGMQPYEEQIMGGIVLHHGRIAEMKTGEGKTLTSVLPVYLNALVGKGVHVVTVNDYLAKRDAKWMGKVHEFLGLRVGVVTQDQSAWFERKKEYEKDITYITNSELGFDYLRDNLVYDKEQVVQRGFYYAIVDEADSIFIDEARTPLIIAGNANTSSSIYLACDAFVRTLTKADGKGDINLVDLLSQDKLPDVEGDFYINEEEKSVSLTLQGYKKAEAYFGIPEDVALTDAKHSAKYKGVLCALRAHYLMKEGHEYIVKNGKIQIVDEFTGRIMENRQYSDGLHQAIEAKEGVEIQGETKTHATITYQNFFKFYQKLSGMTGTAMSEKKELHDIYGVDTIEIPTHRPVIRTDMEDVVYFTKKDKRLAILEQVKICQEKGQPVLIGTPSVQDSEEISKVLKEAGIKHQVLNAKFHEKEAEIISHAGEFGRVTVATNMAGRGTDIILDEKAKEAGGLFVIGSERHESRRIDNQLRGRSGRQGDPGCSRFFISLEDDFIRLFMSPSVLETFKKMKSLCEEENSIPHITSKGLQKQIAKAQKRVEENNYTIRKNLFDYDLAPNKQRELVYAERHRILEKNPKEIRILLFFLFEKAFKGTKEIKDEILKLIPKEKQEETFVVSPEKLKEFYLSYCDRIPNVEALERNLLLSCIDFYWEQHLDHLSELRNGVYLQTYAQKDPVVQYSEKSFEIFEDMKLYIAQKVVYETMRNLCVYLK